MTKPGFTLLELLIAIAIFAGVMVIALGAFARTASTASRSNVVREKTEVARSFVDQLSNDFRFIASTKTLSSGDGCTTAPKITGGSWKGFCLDPVSGSNSVFLLLKYPTDNTYVGKLYFIKNNSSGDNEVWVAEKRGCNFPPTDPSDACLPDIATATNALTPSYLTDLATVFTGQADTATSSGYLQVDLRLKPNDGSNCSVAGSCYELATTLTSGDF